MKIYKASVSYLMTKFYVLFFLKRYYSEYTVVGLDKIPDDEPVLFAANHTNALMDALSVLTLVRLSRPVVFLARADLFNKPVVAKLLRLARIMPAFRMRDGVQNLGKNKLVFDECVDVLHHNRAVCIMPEGNQEVERKLRPLVKGVFRVAFAAQEKYGHNPAVKIIPVGLDFGSLTKARKHLYISVGDPLEVSAYMKEYEQNPVLATNRIRDDLAEQLRKNTLNLATDCYYSQFEDLVEILHDSYRMKLKGISRTVADDFEYRRSVAARLVCIEKEKPDLARQLAEKVSEYTNLLREDRLRNVSLLVYEHRSCLDIGGKLLLLMLCFPVALVGFLFNFIPFYLPVFVRKYILKPEFTGFYSSIHYSVSLLTFPVFYALQLWLIGAVFSVPFVLLVSSVLFFYTCGKVALKYYGLLARIFSMIRVRKLILNSPDRWNRLCSARSALMDLLSDF